MCNLTAQMCTSIYKIMESRILCLENERISEAWWKEITQHAIYNECTHTHSHSVEIGRKRALAFLNKLFLSLSTLSYVFRSYCHWSQPAHFHEMEFQNIANVYMPSSHYPSWQFFFEKHTILGQMKMFCDVQNNKQTKQNKNAKWELIAL